MDELNSTIQQPTEYNDDDIKTLDWMEHIRRRPGMYIGKLGDGSYADDGIYVLLKEVLDNSIDEYMMGYGKSIEVTIEEGTVAVRDYGRGVPLGKVVDVSSKMNTGAKYDSKAFKKSVGLNGVGIKAVNALSSYFLITSYRDGECKRVEYSKAIVTEESDIQPTGEANGTQVFFVPDREIFKDYHYKDEFIEGLLKNYVFLNSGLSIIYNGNRLYYTRTGLDGTELVTVDPATYQQTVLVPNLPKGRFVFTPDESTLLYTVEEEGPKEGTDLIRVLEPADRIPGFRDRSFIWRYDLKTGLYEQLTFGHTDTYINDISADSRYLLFSTSDRVYTSLPHSRNSLYKLDLQTMAIDTIWEKAPYVNQAAFSPDGKQLLVAGAGDAFDGIGRNIKQGQISNSYDGQLFLYDLASRKASPLTKDFNPNVIDAVWNRFNGQIYILCEDEDYQRIYTCDPANGKIKQVAASEDIIMSYALADNAPVLFYYGQSASNANRLYAYDLKGGKNRLVYDLSQDKLKDIALGEVHDWNFKSDDGTTIQGRYYLPPHFDPNKKYPMIVYYYGGTSPTNRALEMRYSMHMYAALGYVIYTLNPSGTTGFGQEFAARHVNAWGLKTADEIIQGTKLFCKEHSFVNEKKIGCIGASYGGFMTQYLQTRTDIFAAAISHAGISALSSYWGEGYWGYGYCSVANAGTYPWNAPEFFTKQSPLFNADKIKTPLLLLHGNADTNVPIGESIQMFAALKILGKTVEFVQVDGENHGIVGYQKRIGWQNTIYAWFAKWLKDEPEWWKALYPDRTL